MLIPLPITSGNDTEVELDQWYKNIITLLKWKYKISLREGKREREGGVESKQENIYQSNSKIDSPCEK